jgi:hypothetical protein
VKKSDNTANAATKLTLKLNKACRHENKAAVVMACAGMIGMALASVPPMSRKIVRGSLNSIIDDIIKEYAE